VIKPQCVPDPSAGDECSLPVGANSLQDLRITEALSKQTQSLYKEYILQRNYLILKG
jgi:hypothetical protein